MAITGVHVLLYSSEAVALRSFFADTLGYDSVDAGDGWLIFALPPAELGVHPGDAPRHEMSLMCDDIEATLNELRATGVQVAREPHDAGYGIEATIGLPGGVEMIVYEPRHPTAI